MRDGLGLVPSRPHLDRDRAVQHGQHPLESAPQLLIPEHEARAGPLLAHHVDGTAEIQVHEVHAEAVLVRQYLRHARVLIGMARGDLHPEHVLARMAPQQGPLGRTSQQELVGEGHLPARDVRAVHLHHPSEGEIPHRGEGGDVHLVSEVDELALPRGERGRVRRIRRRPPPRAGGGGGTLLIIAHLEVTLAHEGVLVLAEEDLGVLRQHVRRVAPVAHLRDRRGGTTPRPVAAAASFLRRRRRGSRGRRRRRPVAVIAVGGEEEGRRRPGDRPVPAAAAAVDGPPEVHPGAHVHVARSEAAHDPEVAVAGRNGRINPMGGWGGGMTRSGGVGGRGGGSKKREEE